jgi:hypothetical protein
LFSTRRASSHGSSRAENSAFSAAKSADHFPMSLRN